jgi:hypothetical protein
LVTRYRKRQSELKADLRLSQFDQQEEPIPAQNQPLLPPPKHGNLSSAYLGTQSDPQNRFDYVGLA